MPRHVFASCQIGAERWLKGEVARARPALRPAFARPGLVTWVADDEVAPDVELGAVFARVWGASVGRADTIDQVAGMTPARCRLHVFPRDPDTEDGWREAARIRAALVATGRFVEDATPAVGDLVADVIVAADEPWLVGLHEHRDGRWEVPGGLPRIDVPAEAPSRAYAKLEQAIAWAKLDPRPGDVAVEIGSAPGGAAMALARRGVEVYGVDPGEMDARVLADPRVHHLPIKIGALRWEDLPAHVDWLLVDVHLAPQVALHAVQRFMPRLRPTLRGAVFTLKLNDDAVVAEIPELVARVGRLGFDDVRATHLPSNRRELCVVAR